MTEIDPLGARLAIQNAQFALQRGHNGEARRLAMQAAQFDPNFEDPWLILATVSSPRASVAYLQHALEINPLSDRATRGMQWALDRLSDTPDRQAVELHHPVVPDTQPVKTVPPPIPSVLPIVPSVLPAVAPVQPVVPPLLPVEKAVEEKPISGFVTDADLWRSFQEHEKVTAADTQPIKIAAKTKEKKKKTGGGNKLTCASIALIVFIILCAIIIIWIALPSWAALANSSSTALPVNVLGKPSLTPTNTATPTATATAIPTPTLTPTPLPTSTPEPTYTPMPVATDIPYVEPTSSEDFSGRWIDVDLTNQVLYAYEDSTVVNSFLVSTGVDAHPTVTGQYYIYVKYTSTLMVGPGYYLPDVPYTMYFYQGYGIHGTYWHNNFGHQMSHGCINMRTSEAEWMFEWASVGTLVNIHY